MKGKLFILGFLLLVCAGAANSQAPRPLLPKIDTGVNATANVTVNATLDPAFILSGTISGSTASTPISVVAVSTGTGSFPGTVNPTAHTYRVTLPAGTYNLTVGFTNSSTSFVYTDSTGPITVSGDATHNITLPTVSTSAITGTISNLLTSIVPVQSVTFNSTTVPGFSDVVTAATLGAGGSYTVQLPNGAFTATLSQELITLAGFATNVTTNPLGTTTVTGPATVNFTAPSVTTADLTGTISFTGSSSIPAGTSLAATDVGSLPPPATVSGGAGQLPSNGAYDFLLGTGRPYGITPVVPVQLLPVPAPSGLYAPPDPGPTQVLNGALTRNITYPAIPGPATAVTISGQVTVTGSGAPVPNARVAATSTTLTGAANTSYTDIATTNATGNYSISVPSGTNYTLLFLAGARATGDFDLDGKADVAVFRPSSGTWFITPSGNPASPIVNQWGTSGDIALRGDFDGDGKTDIAVFRPSNGVWYIIPSSNPSATIVQQWGASGDIPVPGDYDGDGKTDIAVFRPSNGVWYIIPSTNPGSPIIRQWGANGDIPVPGDYDGDGKTDTAVFRPSNGVWYIIPSTNPTSPIVKQWGANGDLPVQADYDGDGKTDTAVFRPSNGVWYIVPSANPGFPLIQQFGASGDIPVPADYDGDTIADIAVWRPSSGEWFVIPSSAPTTVTITQWGTSGDVPIQKPVGQ